MSVVYFVRAGKDGPVKIGWSKDGAVRIKALQTAHHMRLELIRQLDGTIELEHRFHSYFASKRIRGEWFEFDDEMLTVFDPVRPTPAVPGPIIGIPGVISPAQCRAARRWLEMEQADLAKLADCDRDTIRRLECEHHQLRSSTLGNIRRAFEASGVNFTFGREGQPLGIEQPMK
jgi:DNA-binding XRE family transcriptional regulator